MLTKYLIRNATVVSMDANIGVQRNCDVLIDGSMIQAVGRDLPDDGMATIIDGTDAIVSPGFVDTHRHMWQTQLAGLISNHTLLEYFGHCRTVYSSCYTPSDVYTGQYCGALQCLDNGTTFVLDHSHIMNSPSHADSAIKGLLDSKIRGVFCYGFFVNHQPDWADINTGIKPESSPDWRFEDSRRVRETFFPLNEPSDLLRFGMAPFELELAPLKRGIREIEHARSIGSALITSHVALGKSDFGLCVVRHLDEMGVLGKDMHFSHGAGLQTDELDAIRRCDCGLSATPDTELQMAMGHPVAFAAREAGCTRVGLGSDVVCSNPADMFTQMRLLLQAERHVRNQASPQGPPHTVPIRCEEVLHFATLGGARAVGMEDMIGSVTPGKRADLLITRCDSPRMVPVHDPVAALVMFANASDVDAVFVDGKLMKQGGKLVGIDWPKVRMELRESAKAIIERTKGVDFDAVMKNVYSLSQQLLNKTAEDDIKL